MSKTLKITIVFNLICFMLMGSLCLPVCMDSVSADESIVVYQISGNVCDYISGTGEYFSGNHHFYNDSNGVPVYCIQASLLGAGTEGVSGYTAGDARVYGESLIISALQTIIIRGYPQNYDYYCISGTEGNATIVGGIMIDGVLYVCTEDEARAATAFAIHRQMAAVADKYPDSVVGNNSSIYSFSTGASSTHELDSLIDAINDYTISINPQISIKRMEQSANGDLSENESPKEITEIRNGSEYHVFYFKVVSRDCNANTFELENGNSENAFIDRVDYFGTDCRYVKVMVKKYSGLSSVCLNVKASASGFETGEIYGHSEYQDVIRASTSKQIITQSIKTAINDTIKIRFHKTLIDENGSKTNGVGIGFSVWRKSELKTNKDGSFNLSSASPIKITEDGQSIIYTDKNGNFTTRGLEPGDYVVAENKSLEGYINAEPIVVSLTDKDGEIYDGGEITNVKFSARLKLRKIDASTNRTVLRKGFGFKLYSLSDKKYIGGEYFTDENGEIDFGILPYGKYRIEETTVLSNYGYVKGKSVEVTISEESANSEKIVYVEYKNELDKGSATLHKTCENEKLSGVEFGLFAAGDIEYPDGRIAEGTKNGVIGTAAYAYYDSELDEIIYGEYEESSLYEASGNKELLYSKDELIGSYFTDENGEIKITGLYYGKYYIKEVSAFPGCLSNDNIYEFTINGNEIANAEKRDNGETKSAVGKDVDIDVINYYTEYRFYKFDQDTMKPLKNARLAVIKDDVVIDEWISDENYHVIKGLVVGEKYILRELSAPDGFYKTSDVEFEVLESQEPVYVSMNDKLITATVKLYKHGESITDMHDKDYFGLKGKEFIVNDTGLSGVKFGIYRMSDEGDTDDSEVNDNSDEKDDLDEKENLEEKEGNDLGDELVAELITDENGYAEISGIGIGKYYIKEIYTDEMHLLDDRRYEFEVKDDGTGVYDDIEVNVDVLNTMIKKEVIIKKTDASDNTPLQGAKFGLYAAMDIKVASDIKISADELIYVAVSDKEGKVTFPDILPIGEYYVVEIEAPNGYDKDTGKYHFYFDKNSKETVFNIPNNNRKKQVKPGVPVTTEDTTTSTTEVKITTINYEGSPKTGESILFKIVFALAIVSFSGIIIVANRKK